MKNRKKGSLTVEASLVLPIFLFAVVSFLYFFQIMWIQERVHFGLWETGKEISKYGYICDSVGVTGMEPDEYKSTAKKVISGVLTGERMKAYVSDTFLNESCVVGGAGGIQYSTSAFEENNEIYLVATYKVKIPVLYFLTPDYTIVQQVKTRAFAGTEEIGINQEDEDDIDVYVTDTGTVYHCSASCTHINLSIQTAMYGTVSSLRNQYGGKYRACEKCIKNKKLSTKTKVYITTDGDRFHNSSECSGLIRRVKKVKLSTLMGYRPCSRCGN